MTPRISSFKDDVDTLAEEVISSNDGWRTSRNILTCAIPTPETCFESIFARLLRLHASKPEFSGPICALCYK